ncbi:MAG: hypothetical protein GX594_05955 [Pirellulaceae bacterium]|nr:hypothetical protein [Pirellulaceae bacterium]
MRIAILLLILPVLCAAALRVSAPASAYVVNYGADGLPGGTDANADTPLFYDDFETQPADKVSRLAYPDPKDATPTGAGGHGGRYEVVDTSGTGANVQVTDHIGGNAPGAYLGDNYLRITRGTAAVGAVKAWFAKEQTVIGDVIHLEEMVCISNNAQFGAQILGYSAAKTFRFGVYTVANGVVKYKDSAGAFQTLSNITWSRNKWQKWEIDYKIGDTTFDLTIDGTSKTAPVAGSGSLGYFMFFTMTNATPIYLDEPFEVPKSAGGALLASDLAGLLCTRGRNENKWKVGGWWMAADASNPARPSSRHRPSGESAMPGRNSALPE